MQIPERVTTLACRELLLQVGTVCTASCGCCGCVCVSVGMYISLSVWQNGSIYFIWRLKCTNSGSGIPAVSHCWFYC